MIRQWLHARRWKQAAIQVHRTLRPRLLQDYGASDRYTKAQIANSAQRAGIEAAFLPLCFAAVLDKAGFDQECPGAQPTYAVLRALLERYAPARPVAASFQPLTDGSTVIWGGDASFPG